MAQEKLKETWRAMESLYDEGKVRALGVSNFDKETLKTLLKFAKHRPVYCQRLVSDLSQSGIKRTRKHWQSTHNKMPRSPNFLLCSTVVTPQEE
eukprot:6463121-Amphidinium_carterae.1